ncbi:MAG: NAD(P)/FAD-dependent oxidoreductase [Clostridia bacterium]|nr:NAD(P)/FAD-dependent oxidoreductase [Clostridia bacterium]
MNTESMSVGTRNDDVIVIGGGAAGMIAALFSARDGAKTRLLESNEKLGKKVYITGKGRCNLTNTADREAFLQQVSRNPRFLMSALAKFDSTNTVQLFHELGMPTKVERGGRVFPVSDKASDVTKALKKAMEDAGVQIALNTKVTSVTPEEGGFLIETEDGSFYHSAAVIIATGGCTYPATGSTGDGYRFAEKMGLRVLPQYPSLVGMNMTGLQRLQGLTLKNVRLSAKVGNKLIYREIGELLITHFGISGPLVLELSSHMPEKYEDARVVLNLKPGMQEDEIDARLIRELEANRRKELKTVMTSFFPSRLAGLFPELCGLDPEMYCGNVTREQRKEIRMKMTEFPLPVTSPRSMEEAIITRGGVDVKEISPGTMMSKKNPGLFFAGEVLDVDAHTGGFNLQIAWSTGSLAGKSAAAFIRNQ